MAARKYPPVRERFWSYVAKADGDACWLWTGTRRGHGYGGFRMAEVIQAAHRVAWQLERGQIPAGMQVCHRCDNPPCVRPDHLFLGTQADNMADKVAKGRQSHAGGGGLCPVPRKLTAGAVTAIRQRFAHGERKCALAREFGIDRTTVRDIVRRSSWKHVA